MRIVTKKQIFMIAAMACLLTSGTASADIELGLQGFASTDGAGQTGRYGDAGLFLGPDFSYPGLDTGPYNTKNGYREYFNWRWDDVTMKIFDGIGDGGANAGDALISGTMTRIVDVIDGVNRSWGITMNLTGLKYRNSADVISNAVYSDNIVEILATDPENATGYGYEWMNLTLSVTPYPGYGGSVLTTGWIGSAMPWLGHYNVAELHHDARGLTFEAWYENNAWNKWYRVGDTKADVILPTTTVVPVPGAAWMGLSLLGALGGIRTLRSKLRRA